MNKTCQFKRDSKNMCNSDPVRIDISIEDSKHKNITTYMCDKHVSFSIQYVMMLIK